jgi:hypothetical protein
MQGDERKISKDTKLRRGLSLSLLLPQLPDVRLVAAWAF